MNFVTSPRDPSAAYFGRCGPFMLCKAWVGDRWVFTASRCGQLLKSGTREECESACEAFVLPPAEPTTGHAPRVKKWRR